jgi:hypothetical protein
VTEREPGVDEPRRVARAPQVVQCEELWAGQGKKGKKMRPAVSITVGEQTKTTPSAFGRAPTWYVAERLPRWLAQGGR